MSGVKADAKTLVDTPLALVPDNADCTHFTGVGDMRSAIRLQVKTCDVDSANFGDCGRQQVYLSAYQVGDARLLPGAES